MKRRHRAELDLIEALVSAVVRHLHALLDEPVEGGSLQDHVDQLDLHLGVRDDRVVLDSFTWETLAKEAQWVLADLEEREGGASAEACRRALRRALVAEVAPYVRGDKRLAKVAGVLLAALFDEAEDRKRWAQRLR